MNNPMDIYRSALLNARINESRNELQAAAEAVWNAALDAACEQVTDADQSSAIRALRVGAP